MNGTRHVVSLVVVVSACMVSVVGCGIPELPDALEVSVAAQDKETAPQDTGPQLLSNSSWKAFRKPDPIALTKQGTEGPYGGLLNGGALDRPPVDEQIFIVDFDDTGAMAGIRANQYFLESIYGSDVPVGDEWVGSTLPFVRFRSASYGLSMEDRFGVAVLVHVKLADIYVGRAIIYAWGTVDDDRIDGTFGYLLDFTDGIPVLKGGGDQYPFYAERE